MHPSYGFVGIALFGWITAGLASLFVENEEKARRKRPETLHDRFDELAGRLDNIERLLAENGVGAQHEAGSSVEGDANLP